MNFSVVMPLHNEADMLPLTLRSVYDLQPTEILFGVDRCTDNSLRIIQCEAEKHPDTCSRFIHFTEAEGEGWAFRPAYLRRRLYETASNDVILNTSADIQLCPSIKKHLPLIPNNYGLISFHYYEKPWNIQCFERALITRVRPGFAGLLAFSRKAWLETENLEDLKTLPRSEDTHLQLAIRGKYPVKHIPTRSLHLRPNETKIDHYNRGTAIYRQVHQSTVKAFVHSVAMLRPAVFTGFCHAKYGVNMTAKALLLPLIFPFALWASLDDSTEEMP